MIVTLTDYGSEKVVPNYNVMGVAKAALEATVRYLANDLGPKNIRINAIGPGPTDTPLLSPAFTDEFLDAVRKNTPLGRLGTPELVADGILNLLRSDWITGQAVMVDGGASLMSARGGTRDFGPISAKPGRERRHPRTALQRTEAP